jgi:uncharacterized protein YfiM (DUF2279 family)
MGISLGKALGAITSTAGLLSFGVDEAFFAPTRRAGRAAKDALAFDREQAEVAAGRAEAERQQSLRQDYRKERIRRAQITSQAEASGVTGASTPISTIGAGQTLGAAGAAFATGQNMSGAKMTQLGQKSADATARGNEALATGQMWQSAFNVGTTVAGLV